MGLRINSEPIQLAEGEAQRDDATFEWEIRGATSAALLLTDTGETDPAGRYRLRTAGDDLLIERAASAEWGSVQTYMTFSGEGNKAFSINPAVTGGVNNSTDLIAFDPSFTEASSGTHPEVNAFVVSPTFTGAAGGTTKAASMRIGTEPAIGSSNAMLMFGEGTDQDWNMVMVDVTGTPTLSWDESEDMFSLSKGLTVQDGNGLVVGHNAQTALTDGTPETQFVGTTITEAAIGIARFGASAGVARLTMSKSRGALGSPGTAVATGDNLGSIDVYADDGTDLSTRAASIFFDSEGTIGTGRVPTVITFLTLPDTASPSLTEALRINSSQNIGIGTTSPNNRLQIEGQQSADGALAAEEFALFQSDGTGTGAEGDVIIGADNAAGGGDKFAILFDYSAGTVSSARYKENIRALDDPYLVLSIPGSQWDSRQGVHEWGFVAEDVYPVLGRGATPLSPVSAEWWTPEYGERYGYQIGDRAPNQIHLGGLVAAHHEILRDHTNRLNRLDELMDEISEYLRARPAEARDRLKDLVQEVA